MSASAIWNLRPSRIGYLDRALPVVVPEARYRLDGTVEWGVCGLYLLWGTVASDVEETPYWHRKTTFDFLLAEKLFWIHEGFFRIHQLIRHFGRP